MPRTFLTADWHLGDPRVQILGRPFADATEMAERLIVEHNRLVAPEDTVFMIGDACHSQAPEGTHELIARFNGHLTLIKGNHDILPDAVYERYFEQIIADGDGIDMDIDGLACWLTHYPTQSREDRLNLVGHVHAAWKVQKAMLNVGVDCHHFRPMPIEQVGFYFTAICDYYDEDVWCASHRANLAHADRGKPGRYFTAR